MNKNISKKNNRILIAGIFIFVVFIVYFFVYYWLSQFPYMRNRNICLYASIQTMISLTAAIISCRFLNLKKFLIYIILIIIGLFLGDVLELFYIAIENKKQIHEFYRFNYHLMSANNMLWLQILLIGVAFDILSDRF